MFYSWIDNTSYDKSTNTLYVDGEKVHGSAEVYGNIYTVEEIINMYNVGFKPMDKSLYEKVEIIEVDEEHKYKRYLVYWKEQELIESNVKGFYLLPKYPNYAISKDASVLHLKSKSIRTYGEMTTHASINKYPHVYLYNYATGLSVKELIHTMLASVFIYNDDKENKIIVDHIDHDKFNISLDNLRWSSKSDNTKHWHANKKKKR